MDRQDAAQTVVSQFLPGPARRTPDYDALTLADAVWGGGFSGRLNLNLREDKGYSYGGVLEPALSTGRRATGRQPPASRRTRRRSPSRSS